MANKIKGYIPPKQTPDLNGSFQSVIKIANELRQVKAEVQQIANDIKDSKQGPAGKDANVNEIVQKVLARIPRVDENAILARVPKVDEESIIRKTLARVPTQKPDLKVIQETVTTDPMSVIDKILSLPSDKFKLKSSQIDGLEQTLNAFKSQIGNRGYLHGGGDTVVAGSGISLTSNANGTKTISATGGSGTVTSVSVVSANGLAGTVATATTTPAITLSTTITGILEGNGTAISAASTTGSGAVALATSPTFVTSITGSYLTASEILITDASKNLVSAAVATYPSLTELTYVKGVTSAIQTQLNAKQTSDAQLTSLAGLSYTGNTLKVIRVNAGETDFELASIAAGGDVSKVGTPVNNQVGVWTGDGTIEGDAALTFDTSTDVLSSGGLLLSGLTASEIVITDASKNLASAAVATYPSLTELTYVKGVTSAIQTQLGTKQATITFGTNVQTALGVNIGSAGAPVLFDGAGGTPSSLTGTNITGTASGLTAGTVTTNANLTGIVTSTGNATAIADKAISYTKLADGTDGNLITWDASGVAALVATGTSGHVLTSNGAGAAPTFQAAAGGGVTVKNGVATRAVGTASGTQTIAHGLGVTPSYIRITMTESSSTGYVVAGSSGVYNGTTNSSVSWAQFSDTSTYADDGSSVIGVIRTSAAPAGQSAVATFDVTNITLTWTKTGSPTGDNIHIMWEAFE